jgi:hypothetical protein
VAPPVIHISEFDGLLFADAIDRLYQSEAEYQVERLVDHWGTKSPPAVYLLGHLGPAFWRRFTGANRQPLIDREGDRLALTHAIGQEMHDFLAQARLDWFTRAVEPLLIALHCGEFSAIGIREPGHQHGWQREPIPVGVFEMGQWAICREKSRLLPLDQHGNETGVVFGAVAIYRSPRVGPELRQSEPINAGADPMTPAATIRDHATMAIEARLPRPSTAKDAIDNEASDPIAPLSYRTGLPGRPSLKNLIQRELERRASTGEMLKTLAAESRALSDWAAANYSEAPSLPTSRSIENQIRTKYRELTPTK